MATDTLLKIPQEDEIEFTVFVKKPYRCMIRYMVVVLAR
jgi:hypothetical protein